MSRLVDRRTAARAAYFRDRGIDPGALADRALAIGVAVEPLSAYYRAAPRAGLALGYGMIAANDIDAGIRALATCLPRSRAARQARAAPRRSG